MKGHVLIFAWIHAFICVVQISYAQIAPIGNEFWHQPFYNPTAAMPSAVSRDFIPVSPQAASLGIFGQVPVSNFTGTAEINIPLYTIQYKELTVPISISYHASGNKVATVPGPAGLGWALNAGGNITRVINGPPDIGLPPFTPYAANPPTSSIQIDAAETRSSDDWYKQENLDKFIYYAHLHYLKNGDPDTYYYNLNGQAGVFFVDYDGESRIQTPDGQALRFEIRGPGDKPINEKTTSIESILVKDNNGIVYRFEEYEITQEGINSFSSLDETYRKERYEHQISWYLSKITSPNGYSIEFKYKTHVSEYLTEFTDLAIINNNVPITARYDNVLRGSVINGKYLEEIIFPEGTVKFTYSEASGQMWYDKSYPKSSLSGFNNHHENFIYQPHDNPEYQILGTFPIVNFERYPLKLDAITVLDNESNQVQKFRLNYSSSRSTRLWLLNVEALGSGKVAKAIHRFEYNDDVLLPPYINDPSKPIFFINNNGTDHYGYFNNQTSIPQYYYGRPISASAGYINNTLKAHSEKHAQAEILKKITYPTGGYTTFEYEAHEYGGSFKTWPFEVESHENRKTGGVRIKQVSNYDADNTLLTRKRYHYVKNLHQGGNVSSGILAYTPRYVESFENKYFRRNNKMLGVNEKFSFFRLCSNPMYPLAQTKGSHVTYSEVAVEELNAAGQNNGYTVYKYKNFDNGYGDQEPLGWSSDIMTEDPEGKIAAVEYWKYDPGISRILERGQLLSQEIYDINNNLKKEVRLNYYDCDSNAEQGVRYYRLEPNGINLSGYKSYRITAGIHYTFYPYVSRKTEVEYAGSDSIVTVEKYDYAQDYRLIKSREFTDSRNKTYTTMYEYYDFISDVINRPYIIEQSVDNKLLVSHKYTYRNNIVSSIARKYPNEADYTKEFEILKFDKYLNPLHIKERGMETSLFWSYNYSRLAAKVEGAPYSEIQYSVSPNIEEVAGLKNPLLSDMLSEHFYKLYGYRETLTTLYTYKPLVGLASETSPAGTTIYYEYDELGRLRETYFYEDEDEKKKNILESYTYNYSNSNPNNSFLVDLEILQDKPEPSLDEKLNFSLFLSGGSGNYTREWAVYDLHTSQVYQTAGNVNSITTKGYTTDQVISCKVTDHSLGITKEAAKTVHFAPKEFKFVDVKISPSENVAEGYIKTPHEGSFFIYLEKTTMSSLPTEIVLKVGGKEYFSGDLKSNTIKRIEVPCKQNERLYFYFSATRKTDMWINDENIIRLPINGL